MQFTQTRSHALPPSRANSPQKSAARPAAGGGAPQIEPVAARGLSDLHQLQAEWDRAGTIRRLRLVATTPVLRHVWLIPFAWLVAIGLTLPLAIAALGGLR